MCHPAIAIGANVLGAVAAQNAQAEAFEANAAAALAANQLDNSAVNEELALKDQAQAEEKINRSLEGRQKTATALVSAGESGVSGNSVDALMNELNAGVLRGNTMTSRNFQIDQISARRQLEGNARTAQSRINSVAKPSKSGTALQIGGAVASGTTYTKSSGFGFKKQEIIMTGVIDTVRTSSNFSETPRIYRNLISTDFSTWSDVVVGTALTPVVSGVGNDTFLSSKTAGSGRCIKGTAYNFEAGKTYVFGCTVSDRLGGSVPQKKDLLTYATVSGSDASVTELIIQDGTASARHCVRFTVSASSSGIIRLGLGSSGNDTSSVLSEVLSKPFLYEIPSLTSEVPDYLPSNSVGVYNYEVQNTVAANGQITEVSATPTNFTNPALNKVGMFIGDSYSNDLTEWPDQLVKADTNMVIIGDGNSGQDTEFFETHIDDLLAMTDYELVGDVEPTFVILQGSVNNIISNMTVEDTITSTTNLINKVKAAGLVPILTNIAPQGQSSSVFNATDLQLLTDTNTALAALASSVNVKLVDIYTALVSVDGTSMEAAYYEGVDPVHPNEAGSVVIANAIAPVIVDAFAIYTVCSLTVSNSYQTPLFQASTVCPLGRDWGTKRYTTDGLIIPNYIHDE